MELTSRLPGAKSLGTLLLSLLCGCLYAHPDEFDIVVYGGTSGGVTAAVQAARMGKKVALVSPTSHLGGLTSSGLGWTDLGNTAILGGLSKDFYRRVYLHYSGQKNWETIRKMGGQGGERVGDYGSAFHPINQTGSIFEPKVAEAIFKGMLAEWNVPVFTGLLDLNGGVIMEGQRITGLRMEDGEVFRGKMFIDACYEGDVMAGAGVSWFIGREANSVHGETNSGVQAGRGSHNFGPAISAYVIPGDPSSGLLPGIEPSIRPNGTGDHRLQAYCFRMCLTSREDNRQMIAQPPDYDPVEYELLLRLVEAGQSSSFFKLDSMPNGKTDSNNTGAVSCDYIGRNYGPDWNWATLNHAQRAALAKKHENWQRGLIWTLQNHPRVKALHSNGLYSSWGLPKDEFTDNGNWPYQLYVREARRMISDYVMTQKNCRHTAVAPDSVGLAAYTMDSHHVQRYVTSGGLVKNEGDVQDGTAGPYPISYRSIVPKVGECENLLVPWCLSSSHMAFGSIRMEPVFMGLGQSAATAAAIAINDNISVQQVPYEKLVLKLRADGQALTYGSEEETISGVVVDNADPTGVIKVGDWTPSTSTSGFYGNNYLVDGNVDKGTKSIRFVPDLPASGVYTVALRWPALDNRATNVPVSVIHADGVYTTTVNQELNNNAWVTLGTFQFSAGTTGSLLIETTGTDEFVIADAARWTFPGPNNVVNVVSAIPTTIRGAQVPAELIVTRKGSSDQPLAVSVNLGGTAGIADYSPSIGTTVTIPAGRSELTIPISAPAGPIPLGDKTVAVTVVPSAGYFVGTSTTAGVTLKDPPFDAWRAARFTPEELGDTAVSGAGADPDGDGMTNLLEFFSGGKGPGSQPELKVQDGKLYLRVRRHEQANGIPMEVWESGNLSDWGPSPRLPIPELFEKDGEYRFIGLPVRELVPSSDEKRFFKLRIGN